MVSLAGVPFPYDPQCMPARPAALAGTWVEGALNISYRTEGTAARVKELMDRAAAFQIQRDVPMLCGEFGVYIPNSDPEQRVRWYDLVRTYLEDNGMAWTTWDYTGGFGLFNPGGHDLFAHDLNVPLAEALGLSAPAQSDFVLVPDTGGFALYTDYFAPGVYDASWGDGILDYYDQDNPRQGPYCMAWTGADRYQQIGFDFRPDKDLSELVAQGYALDFWMRGDSPGARLDVRFVDTKIDAQNHPWRIRKTIDESLAAWDGTWQHVRIPLADFREHGAWDDGWFNPTSQFDWQAVDRFEIVAEHHSLEGIRFWFDEIQVLEP